MHARVRLALAGLVLVGAAAQQQQQQQQQQRCAQPPETGPCRASLERFHWSASEQRCRRFTFGGCKGNGNNFLTVQECEAACGGGGGGAPAGAPAPDGSSSAAQRQPRVEGADGPADRPTVAGSGGAVVDDLGTARPLKASTRPEPLRFPGDEPAPEAAQQAAPGGGGAAGGGAPPAGAGQAAAGLAAAADSGTGGSASIGGVANNGTIGSGGTRLPRDEQPQRDVNGQRGGGPAAAVVLLGLVGAAVGMAAAG
jgi:hypothetical protein